ncbi:MAG: flagellar basal body-associated FliL family protein [Pseudomonadota bacterium]
MKALLGSLIPGIGAGAIAMGAVYLAPSPETPTCDAPGEDMAHADDHSDHPEKEEAPVIERIADEPPAFVSLEPLVVSLGPQANSKYLKISISVETTEEHAEAITKLSPRFRDVLNTFLRAVDERDLADPTAMTRLRSQILRRVQLVANGETVNDILITDFILT